MSTHILKCDELWFRRLADGSKTAEIREHDRDYQIGDTLVFIREDYGGQMLSMRPTHYDVIAATLTHILPATVFPGLAAGYSLLSLKVDTVVTSVAADDFDAQYRAVAP